MKATSPSDCCGAKAPRDSCSRSSSAVGNAVVARITEVAEDQLDVISLDILDRGAGDD
jgi:hypothetical protein